MFVQTFADNRCTNTDIDITDPAYIRTSKLRNRKWNGKFLFQTNFVITYLNVEKKDFTKILFLLISFILPSSVCLHVFFHLDIIAFLNQRCL